MQALLPGFSSLFPSTGPDKKKFAFLPSGLPRLGPYTNQDPQFFPFYNVIPEGDTVSFKKIERSAPILHLKHRIKT